MRSVHTWLWNEWHVKPPIVLFLGHSSSCVPHEMRRDPHGLKTILYAKLGDDEHRYFCRHSHCNAAIVVLVELILPDRPFVIVQQYDNMLY